MCVSLCVCVCEGTGQWLMGLHCVSEPVFVSVPPPNVLDHPAESSDSSKLAEFVLHCI